MKAAAVFASLAAAFLQPVASTPVINAASLQARTFNHDHLPFKKITIFGDSLSDDASHGAWVITNHTWPADKAYYKGRFSNGPTWVENVAKAFHLPLVNYAIGGATSNNTLVQGATGPGSTVPVPSMLDQVSTYLKSKHDSAHISETLFCILIGGNDPFFLPTVQASQTVQAIEFAVNQLHKAGAKSFVLLATPSLAIIPYDKDAGLSAAAISALGTYSINLRDGIKALGLKLQRQSKHSHSHRIKVAFVDLLDFLNTVLDNPKKYGFDPKTKNESCLKGVYFPIPGGRTLCKNPDKYIWWDEFHPTEAGHKWVAKVVENAIQKRF
jgi:phospholipase/lecithinase/hemolysin